ncbi:MAG TPA: hypothetical protein VKN14_10130 [Flavobacteriaceae bacterium]|nr:hypothetical protein [Flavobacteriaceae bacterium]
MTDSTEITYEDFLEIYEPDQEDSGLKFYDPVTDWSLIQKYISSKRVWTLISTPEGLIISNGPHMLNTFFYILTKNPYLEKRGEIWCEF